MIACYSHLPDSKDQIIYHCGLLKIYCKCLVFYGALVWWYDSTFG